MGNDRYKRGKRRKIGRCCWWMVEERGDVGKTTDDAYYFEVHRKNTPPQNKRTKLREKGSRDGIARKERRGEKRGSEG